MPRWSVGDQVKIVTGPFNGLTGQVERAADVNGIIRVVVRIYNEPKIIEVASSQLERIAESNLN